MGSSSLPQDLCSGYKHFTLIDEKTSLPLSVMGAYIATMAPYLNIWCLQYFPLIQRRQRNRHTPLESSSQILYRTCPGCHPGTGTTCNGYKHFTLMDGKTSLPISVRGAYIATTAPYLNIWCLQYFSLIQRRQRNRHTMLNPQNERLWIMYLLAFYFLTFIM